MKSEKKPLKSLFISAVGGSWGTEPGQSDIDLPCIRGTDFDHVRLRVEMRRAPVRGFTYGDIQTRAAVDGDIIIEKSGGGGQQPVGRAVLWDQPDPVMPTNFAARLRTAPHADPRFVAYLLSSLWAEGRTRAAIKQTTGIQNLDLTYLLAQLVVCPTVDSQRVIADYLDRETGRIDAMVAAKKAIVERLYERCEADILRAIGSSGLVTMGGPTIELRRVLKKHRDEAPPGTPLVTAYRDGQVTLRGLRRAEGYTEAAENSGYFIVSAGDVVLHGLDGFAGAVGTAESSGACSPAYHVLRPLSDADPYYWGRMLRVLAVTGYLALFVTSTRERAYDMRNWEVMGRVPVPVVPNHEQLRVGRVLRKIPVLRDNINTSIALLQEHRQALVTAAVTGRLDVEAAS
jgi:type I restriction enzyme S subunit